MKQLTPAPWQLTGGCSWLGTNSGILSAGSIHLFCARLMLSSIPASLLELSTCPGQHGGSLVVPHKRPKPSFCFLSELWGSFIHKVLGTPPTHKPLLHTLLSITLGEHFYFWVSMKTYSCAPLSTLKVVRRPAMLGEDAAPASSQLDPLWWQLIKNKYWKSQNPQPRNSLAKSSCLTHLIAATCPSSLFTSLNYITASMQKHTTFQISVSKGRGRNFHPLLLQSPKPYVLPLLQIRGLTGEQKHAPG